MTDPLPCPHPIWGAPEDDIWTCRTCGAVWRPTNGAWQVVVPGNGIDPRGVVDQLVASTEPPLWFQALDHRGDDVALERKWDIVEWYLQSHQFTDLELERASGLSIAGYPDVRSMDFVATDNPNETRDLFIGTLTQIKMRNERGERTNTFDLIRSVSRDRRDPFGNCERTRQAGFLASEPPGFQWTITTNGWELLDQQSAS